MRTLAAELLDDEVLDAVEFVERHELNLLFPEFSEGFGKLVGEDIDTQKVNKIDFCITSSLEPDSFQADVAKHVARYEPATISVRFDSL